MAFAAIWLETVESFSEDSLTLFVSLLTESIISRSVEIKRLKRPAISPISSLETEATVRVRSPPLVDISNKKVLIPSIDFFMLCARKAPIRIDIKIPSSTSKTNPVITESKEIFAMVAVATPANIFPIGAIISARSTAIIFVDRLILKLFVSALDMLCS